MAGFLHGVEVIDIDSGARPIRTVKSSVIGLVGTAPEADAEKFPLNTPVLIAGTRKAAAGLKNADTLSDNEGTLPKAIDGIFDQAGALIVVIRVAEGDVESETDTLTNIRGGVDETSGEYTGVHALLAAESIVKVTPRILIAPGFTQELSVATELQGIADRLRAVVIVDGPNTNNAAAIDYSSNFGKRMYVVDPWVKAFSPGSSVETIEPASARVAGLIAKSDNERGFWWSPSNQQILGITGTARAIDFVMGDQNAQANLLNAGDANGASAVATIIQQNGYRLWGNRTSTNDSKWAFLSVVRTADLINDSLQRAHLWAVDRNITKTYLDDVLEGVNAYLRELKALGAIINGNAWADPELNTPTSIASGKVYIDFDFTPPYPAEHITFRSHLVNDYLLEILAA